MSNAAKHRKKAAEFEQLKQVDRAIAMYIKAIDEAEAEGEEVDVALLNKVGDLTMRQGRIADAVTYYERAVEHYASASLFNNAIALCNKILRNAPGRSNVYFTLGRICAKKGLRGDATRNFLEYATRMQQEGRIDEGMRALAEVAHLMPELTEVRQLVEEHAVRVGIELPRRKTPAAAQAPAAGAPRRDNRTSELIFLDIGESGRSRNTPPLAPRIPTPKSSKATTNGGSSRATPNGGRGLDRRPGQAGPESLEAFLLFDPTRPGAVTPVGARAITPAVTSSPIDASAQRGDDMASVDLGADVPAVPAVPETTDAGLASIALELTSDAPSAESVVDPNADVLQEPMAESVVEPVLGLVVDAPDVELVADLVQEAGVQPTAEYAVESAVDLVVEPVMELAVEPITELAAEPITELTVEPIMELTVEPITELTVEPITDLIADSVVAVAVEPPLDLVVEPSVVEPSVVEPIVEVLAELDMDATPAAYEVTSLPSLIVDSVPVALEIAPADEPSWASESPYGEIAEPPIDLSAAVALTGPVEGLEIDGAGLDTDAPILDGLLVDDALGLVDDETSAEPNGFMEVDASAHEDGDDPGVPSVLDPVDSTHIAALPDLLIEDFDHVADDPHVAMVTGGRSGTPAYGTTLPHSLTPIEVTPVPELEEAIAAGALAAERGASEYVMEERRPPFRLDPHDFILPGELPPLMVDDAVVASGLQSASWIRDGRDGIPPVYGEAASAQHAAPEGGDTPRVDPEDAEFEHDDTIFMDVRDVGQGSSLALEDLAGDEDEVAPVELAHDVAPVEHVDDVVHVDVAHVDEIAQVNDVAQVDVAHLDDAAHVEAIAQVDEVAYVGHVDETDPVEHHHAIEASDELVEEGTEQAALEPTHGAGAAIQADASAEIPPDRAMATTPSLPIAAVAAEANLVATSRCEELGAAVAASPSDWVLRRRHAEALFEVGSRERGLAELQVALSGFAQGGHLGVASDIADELVRISPERIAYHQKRVELSVRLNDQLRLRGAYLDLADALLASGDEARAHAVYARVLELDPWDQRARAALGAAAPPPPPQATPEEEYVDLAEWLRDDEPSSTRMRMRAPQVSGDEQADFESLLRHFKEGVSRSLGEEDYESHYDLGVAYKEMGLLDDAIAEFQKALRSRRHRLPAYEALGQCFVEQSRHSVAATVLTRALHEPGLGDEHRVGVLYLLAYSCEALQRWDEARSYYSRVFATDIHFRDVAARLAALDLIAR